MFILSLVDAVYVYDIAYTHESFQHLSECMVGIFQRLNALTHLIYLSHGVKPHSRQCIYEIIKPVHLKIKQFGER